MKAKNFLAKAGTSIPAVVAAVFGFVLFAPTHFEKVPVVKDIAAYIFAGGLATFGINAVTHKPEPPKED